MSKVSKEIREAEDRETFLYFFTTLLVFMFLLGGWFLIDGIAQQTNLTMNFWGIYTMAVGFAVVGLSSFPTFYRDRYRVTAMGLILSIGGYLYAVFAAPQAISNLAKGILIMFLGGVAAGYIHYLNEIGWDLVRGNKKRFIALVILLALFLIIWGLLGNAYSEVFFEATQSIS